MSQSIYMNDELENEVSSDMSYFWNSDNANDVSSRIKDKLLGNEVLNCHIIKVIKTEKQTYYNHDHDYSLQISQ